MLQAVLIERSIVKNCNPKTKRSTVFVRRVDVVRSEVVSGTTYGQIIFPENFTA